MRTLAAFVALAVFALPAFAAKRITVEQLEQVLAGDHGKLDAEVARDLSDLELTERLSTVRLSRLASSLPGEKARQALTMLADPSAFLDLPAKEIPAAPAPDVAAQRKILALTVNYVSQIVHQLPNFFATRVTTNYEDTPSIERPGAITREGLISSTAYQPLHLVANLSATVSYRDGHEIVDTDADKDTAKPVAARRLTTSGVFGPILGVVLVDAAKSQLKWSHWEQGKTGLVAVFSYAVPKEKSHYTVNWDSPPANAFGACIERNPSLVQIVAYHGEMAIDPASGTILRLVLVADMKPGDIAVKSGIAVEYGQVEIGGKSYFVPVKSISSSLAHVLRRLEIRPDCHFLQVAKNLKTSLNDVVFDQYHVFRTETKMLTDDEVDTLESQPR